jgi:phage gp29-like protein
MTLNKDLRQEIATIAKDPTVALYGGVLSNQDDTLLSRGGGKGLKIYDEIERDCHAFAVLQKRKLAIIAREWQLLPASESALDKKAAELVERQLHNLRFDQVCVKLLDATLKGYSVAEILWGYDGAEIVARRVKVKPQRRFIFDEDQQARLLTPVDQVKGEQLPPRKFIVHRCGEKDDDNPYGLGLGHKLFWPVFFKKQDLTFWLTFVDKFAAPTAVGEYPNGTSEADQKKLLASLSTIASEAGIIVPQGMVVKLLEAARSGSIDTYERLARYLDEQISECVLGETLSTNIGNSGSLAASKTHNEVRLELAKGDSDLLSDTLNETLIRWIVELNLPGAKPPQLWRDFAEGDDLKVRSERDKNLVEMGFEPDLKYINETYGGKWTKKAKPAQPQQPAPGEPLPAQFAEAEVDTVDQLTEQLLAESDGSDMVAAVYRLLEECGSLDEAQEKLLDLYERVPIDKTGQSLGDRLFQAELTGRAEILDRTEADQ